MNAKTIKTDGFKNIITLQSFKPAVDISNRKGIHVPHMQTFRRGIGIHHQVVKWFFGIFQIRFIQPLFLPHLLPLRFNLRMVVGLIGHIGHIGRILTVFVSIFQTLFKKILFKTTFFNKFFFYCSKKPV